MEIVPLNPSHATRSGTSEYDPNPMNQTEDYMLVPLFCGGEEEDFSNLPLSNHSND